MLKRISLREQIQEVIRNLIINGEIDSIVEAELARSLDVSRTPLREALIGLEQEGFLCSSPGKGFHILPMTAREYTEVMHLISAIEEVALLACPDKSARELLELRDLNQKLAETVHISPLQERAREQSKLDNLWHDLLVEGSQNETSLHILSTLKKKWIRYEFAFWSVVQLPQKSVEDHEEIIQALEKNDLQAAARVIREKQWQGSQKLFELLQRQQ